MTAENGKLIIRLEDIKRIYKVGVERIHALDGIDLRLFENEYVAVMGQSGSGKSTLMNVLGCLDKASSGYYELDGQDTTQLSDAELARVRNERIGFVFQSFELLGQLTALRNVEIPLIYSRREVCSLSWLQQPALLHTFHILRFVYPEIIFLHRNFQYHLQQPGRENLLFHHHKNVRGRMKQL